MSASRLRIGYVPFSPDLTRPGDRRRFPGYASRRGLEFEIARSSETYDVLVLSQSADISVWAHYDKGQVIYDLIDSYLAIPRSDLKQLLRGPAKYLVGQFGRLKFDYKGAVQEMCRRSDAVVCTTEEQRHQIQRFCPNVHIALDFHSSVAKQYKTTYSSTGPIRIVWEGLGVNVSQLEAIKDVLRSLATSTKLRLVLVTDLEYYRWLNKIGRVQTLEVARKIFEPVDIEAWKEDTCSGHICGCDIGVIPLDMYDPFAAGKPENKLLLMWRMGMPVVSSATPAYVRAMKAAGTPELACVNTDDWAKALRSLVADEGARRIAGSAGRAFANENWSDSEIVARWDRVLTSVGVEVH